MTRAEQTPPADLPPEPTPIRWVARLASAVWWLLFTLLVLLALYAGIGRQLTQNIDSFRDELAAELSARTGTEVRIGSLRAQWNWLDPAILANGIDIVQPESGDFVARLQHLRIRLDFLTSLLRFRIVFEDFEADGLELTLRQAPDGELSVEGAELPGTTRNHMQTWLELAGRWMSDPYVKLTRITLGITDSQNAIRYLDIPQLDLIYHQGLFRASGRAMRSGTTEQLANFSLVGQHFFRGDFTGQVYLNVSSGRLFDGLIDRYQWQRVRIEGFDLGGEAWLTFQGGNLQQVSGTVRTPYLQLGTATQSLAPMEDIHTRFGWRRSRPGADSGSLADFGEWHFQGVAWRWGGMSVPAFNFALLPQANGDVVLLADAVPLRPVSELISSLPLLPEAVTRALDGHQPEGYLDGVRLVFPSGRSQDFRMSGQLRDFGVQPYDGSPGLAGVDGQLSVTRQSGFVTLSAGQDGVRLGFPELFNDSWLFPEFTGTVAWQLDGPVTRVYADDLRMGYRDGTQLTGAFDLRMARQGEDNLGLRIGIRDGRADMLADFVPAKLVDPGLYDWLTSAITEARITEGVYYGHGQIGREAPKGSFVSSMWYAFESASVRYDPRWPAVTNAAGKVTIHNNHTRVALTSAQTGGLRLAPSEVVVVPGEVSQILVRAAADVPGAQIPYWLANTPLGAMAGEAARRLEFAGDYALTLALTLPLSGDAETVAEARIQTGNGSVRHPEADLAWTGIKADLTYHSINGFSGKPLQAVFFGEPVTIHLARNRAGDALSIRQDGTLAFPQTLAQLGAGSDAAFGLEGTLAYSADLTVGADTTSRIRVRSDLHGLAVEWPEPLGKPAAEVAPVQAYIDPQAPGGVAVSGVWENRVGFDLLMKDTGFDARINHLYLGTQTLENIEIEALDLADRWVLSTRSDRAIGRIVLPEDPSPVLADFEVFRLVTDGEGRDATPEVLTFEQQLEAFRALDLGSWPDVDVAIADLRLNDSALGSWRFTLRPEPFRLAVNDIEGRLDSLTLLGDMSWSIIDDREVSRFAGTITGGAMADLNDLFDTEIPLTNEQTSIELDVDWPGRPDAFTLRDLNGSVSLRLDDGLILEQSNTAQLFRVFNLLNADTLWRRLKLDFSDLYERGVAFDAISGKAQIVDGRVSLNPELQVVGPSGAFKLSGSTDMARETLNMRLVVVLPLTQNLPLAALLMGAGAPIGGALFVLDKVLGDPLSKLTSATYSVTGTWDEPEVKLQRVFDTGQ